MVRGGREGVPVRRRERKGSKTVGACSAKLKHATVSETPAGPGRLPSEPTALVHPCYCPQSRPDVPWTDSPGHLCNPEPG